MQGARRSRPPHRTRSYWLLAHVTMRSLLTEINDLGVGSDECRSTPSGANTTQGRRRESAGCVVAELCRAVRTLRQPCPATAAIKPVIGEGHAPHLARQPRRRFAEILFQPSRRAASINRRYRFPSSHYRSSGWSAFLVAYINHVLSVVGKSIRAGADRNGWTRGPTR